MCFKKLETQAKAFGEKAHFFSTCNVTYKETFIMKKYILLTTTAMLLSAVALKANADSNSAQLEIKAVFTKPMELMKEQYLGFGRILADEGKKRVVVKPNGELDEANTTATMLSVATYVNYGEDYYNDGSLNEGIIRAKGFLNDSMYGDDPDLIDEQFLNSMLVVDIPAQPIKLTSGNIDCGTVSNFIPHITRDNKDVLIHIGGTLETEDLSEISDSISCQGNTTVTVIYNDEFMKNMGNSM